MQRRLLAFAATLGGALLIACSSTREDTVPLEELTRGLAVQRDAEQALLMVDAGRLRTLHSAFASEPHEAGTEGDSRLIGRMVELFDRYGLEVEEHRFTALVTRPISAELELLSPERMSLAVREKALVDDEYSRREDLWIGFNGYSASGEATGEVVYANQGRKEDFERLAELGVDCTDKIVVARYGGNFRGYKAKFAQAAGAAALVIYSDPKDAGYSRGLSWPEGGFANDSYIQRGSVLTLPYSGDPQTPFVEATAGVKLVDEEELALPAIPVQPVGWAAAQEILSRMEGRPIEDQGWQGGLPFRYRLEGGAELRVRVAVQNERLRVETANVVGTLRGSELPEERVVLGCHHDAWAYGAADPTCGLIAVFEAARVFGELARRGQRPKRSLSFAAWGAEEYGIIGSSEWVEAHLEELRDGAVAYFNLDAAATGLRFGSSASPSLQRLVARAAALVPQPTDPPTPPVLDAEGSERTAGTRVLEPWRARGTHAGTDGLPRFGNLGGGSDHVGFIALAGVACASLNGSGAPGVAYHSIYDNLEWYRRIVGDDYASAQMIARMAVATCAELGYAPVLGLDPAAHGRETVRHLEALTKRGQKLGFFDAEDGGESVASELRELARRAERYGKEAEKVESVLARVRRGLGGDRVQLDVAAIDQVLLEFDRAWLHPAGIPGRPWFQNLFAAPDESSGYAAWMLPGLRHAVETGNREELARMLELYGEVFGRLESALDRLEGLLRV